MDEPSIWEVVIEHTAAIAFFPSLALFAKYLIQWLGFN